MKKIERKFLLSLAMYLEKQAERCDEISTEHGEKKQSEHEHYYKGKSDAFREIAKNLKRRYYSND